MAWLWPRVPVSIHCALWHIMFIHQFCTRSGDWFPSLKFTCVCPQTRNRPLSKGHHIPVCLSVRVQTISHCSPANLDKSLFVHFRYIILSLHFNFKFKCFFCLFVLKNKFIFNVQIPNAFCIDSAVPSPRYTTIHVSFCLCRKCPSRRSY